MPEIKFEWDDEKHPFNTGTGGKHEKRVRFFKSEKESLCELSEEAGTIRLDEGTIKYFKEIATNSGIPHQTLINLYLRDCAASGRKLSMEWKVA